MLARPSQRWIFGLLVAALGFAAYETWDDTLIKTGEAEIPEDQVSLLLEQLRPVDLEGAERERIGSEHDGGYVTIAGLSYDRLHGYGVGDNMDFEVDFLEHYPVDAYLYDHTIPGLPTEPPASMTWLKEGVGPERTDDLDTIAAQIDRNGGKEHRNLFLKMDVEGWEWPSLAVTSDEDLQRFRQIVIELHDLGLPARFEQQIEVLERLNRWFDLAHVHGNNYGPMLSRGEFEIPQVLEATWVRKGEFAVSPSTASFPIEDLDAPNRKGRRDLQLDGWPFAPGSR